jgi:hypothetical protein
MVKWFVTSHVESIVTFRWGLDELVECLVAFVEGGLAEGVVAGVEATLLLGRDTTTRFEGLLLNIDSDGSWFISTGTFNESDFSKH